MADKNTYSLHIYISSDYGLFTVFSEGSHEQLLGHIVLQLRRDGIGTQARAALFADDHIAHRFDELCRLHASGALFHAGKAGQALVGNP